MFALKSSSKYMLFLTFVYDAFLFTNETSATSQKPRDLKSIYRLEMSIASEFMNCHRVNVKASFE